MKISILKSGSPINDKEKNQIKDIFNQSKNPNESLINSIDTFKSFDGQFLYLEDKAGPAYKKYSEVIETNS